MFLTVGAGDRGFEQAADRLEKGVKTFDVFEKVVSIKTNELVSIIPNLRNQLLESTRGFGFYSWKPRLARMALEGYWGKYDGICFADAGCEANPNWLSRKTLINRIELAHSQSILAYAISTPEREMTKNGILVQFPDVAEIYPNFQFQSGTFYLSGEDGYELACNWDEFCWKDEYHINDVCTHSDVQPYFVEHRHEQSVFSLFLKRQGVRPFFPHPPGYDRPQFPSRINIQEPLWWSRNRSGQDLRSFWHKRISI